jgi:hypothetical protein
LALGLHKDVAKVGVWDTLQYDALSDIFLFDPTCAKSAIDTWTAVLCPPSTQGIPDEFLDTSEDKDDGVNSSHVNKTLPVHLPPCASELETSSTEDSKRYEGRPTVCKIDELHLEIVDESDNLVTGAMGKGIAFVTVPL